MIKINNIEKGFLSLERSQKRPTAKATTQGEES